MSKIKKVINNLEEEILNIVLPKKCFNCQTEGSFLCPECLALIKLNSWQVCPVCQKSLTESGEICRYCKQLKPSLDGLTAATSLDDPLISKLVHSFKYRFLDELSTPLATLLIRTYQKNKLSIPDIIIPVPLHPLRLRWRGFNQAELLAQNLSKNLLPGLPIEINAEILTRIKFTNPQANLKKAEDRQKNIQDAFQINPDFINQAGRSDQIKNKRILLIDDISASGNTFFECGKQLRKLKPKSIQALVIARQK